MEIPSEKPRRGWLRTHWKLVLAVWLGLSLSGAVAAFYLLSNSDATKLAVATAESNPALAERLGRPLKTGWFVSGSIEVTHGSGHAELAIPVSGPKGRGTLYAEARKHAGLWHLELLQFGSNNSTERLDLLAANVTQQTSPTQ
jgi:cytochrome oxidase complex assembly protein 1